MSSRANGVQWTIKDKHQLLLYVRYCEKMLEEHKTIQVKCDRDEQRTQKQNNAMWLWLSQIAQALNDAGYDMKKTLKPHIEIPWNKERAKEHLWNPIQQIVTSESSSTDLSRQQINEIQEVIARHLAQTTGVSVPFPKRQEP